MGRVVDQHFGAVFPEFMDDVDDPGIAKIRAVLFKGEAQHPDLGLFDGVSGFNHLFDALCDNDMAHVVVDATTGQDDFGVVPHGFRLEGEVVRVDTDAVPPHQAGEKFRKFHLEPAAARTFFVSIPIRSKIRAIRS